MSLPLDRLVGLNNFNVPHNSLMTPPANGNGITNIGSGPNGYLYGSDFRNIYALDTTLTGAGQSVALVEFDDYYENDISLYKSTGNPPLADTPVLSPGSSVDRLRRGRALQAARAASARSEDASNPCAFPIRLPLRMPRSHPRTASTTA
jgi:hypothetical protein